MATGSRSAAQREQAGWIGWSEGDCCTCVMEGVRQVFKLHEALGKHFVGGVMLVGRECRGWDLMLMMWTCWL